MAAQDYSEYTGKKVILTHSKDGENVEVEGTVDSANALGVLIKPKGKTNLNLIEAKDIVEVRFAPEKPKTLKAKKLAPVQYGQARQHLADRHGYALSDLVDYSEADAYEFHKTIDHSDLGHKHEVKEQAEAAEAAEAGESSEG